MYLKHLNGLWLIMVSLLSTSLQAQISISGNTPVEIKINCDEKSDLKAPKFTSTCEGELKISYDDRTFSGGCLGTIERTWTATDDCGNEFSYAQYIQQIDKKAPSLSSYPENISVSANAIPEIPVITAQDNCDKNIQVEFSESSEKNASDETTRIIRKWSAKDACGNIESHEQTISILSENP